MHKIKQIVTKMAAFVLVLAVLLSSGLFAATEVFAAQSDTNEESGYRYVLDDDAGFIEDNKEILNRMKEITQYCNVAVVTTTSHSYRSTESYAVATFESYFGDGADGVVFVIDRDLNEIYLASEGSTRRILSNAKCRTICDNTYIYATEGHNYDYDTCCKETLTQVNTLLLGGHITQPMRYISSIFIALAIGMILCFLYVFKVSKSRKATSRELFNAAFTNVQVHNPSVHYVGETKRYSPQSSGSGGGGHSSHHSGGGHSGGHSGGGHHI